MRTIILLTVSDIADLLNVSPETVRKWVKQEKLKPLYPMNSKKEGMEFIFEDFQEFLNNHHKYQESFIKSMALRMINDRES